MKRLLCMALVLALTAPVWAKTSKKKAAPDATPQATAVSTPEATAVSTPMAPIEKPSVKSKVPIELYGYLKLDMSWDQNATDSGNYARWVDSPEKVNNEHKFNLTARETRLGANFLKSENSNWGGKVEMDFYGTGDAENKPSIMMRHAYLQYDNKDSDVNLLAGQTSDVISPLAPPMVDYTVGWWAGNIGYRRPQLRFSLGSGRESKYRTLLQVSVGRFIGDSETWTADSVSVTVAPSAQIPVLEGRLSKSFPLGGDKSSAIGVWGHWVEMNYDLTPSTVYVFDSSSIGGDVELNLCSKFSVKGEGFWGRNLGPYLGGIGESINTGLGREIRARGGWAAISMGPYGRMHYNAGIGVDKPITGDLAAGMRSCNDTIWVNDMIQLDKVARLGLEVSRWRTEYIGLPTGDSVRVQSAFYYDL